MSCNAFGHPPDCNCGWGGEFHGSTKDGYSNEHWQRIESYTNPNAKCPACGQMVYFYRSREGGGVYFDELGPPWPKHECTQHNAQKFDQALQLHKHSARSWPFIRTDFDWLPNDEGTLLIDSEGKLLLVRADWKKVPLWAPLFLTAHPKVKGRYFLSFPQKKRDAVIEVKLDAYSVEALSNPDHARHFPSTIHWIRTNARNLGQRNRTWAV